MEALLESIDKTRTGIDAMKSKRPEALAIGKNKLSKLFFFLMKTKGEGFLTEKESVSFWVPHVYLSMFESSQEANVTVIWPYMKVVILTQTVMVFCSGTLLSTALLYYSSEFGLNSDEVGILLGIGEALGMLVILMKNFLHKSKKGSNISSRPSIMKAIISHPLNVPFILIVLSLCSMLFSLNDLALAIVFQMILSLTNYSSVSLLNELSETSLPPEKLRYYQGIGQWLRQFGYISLGFLGPFFFDYDLDVPFVFFGHWGFYNGYNPLEINVYTSQ